MADLILVLFGLEHFRLNNTDKGNASATTQPGEMHPVMSSFEGHGINDSSAFCKAEGH